MDFKTEQQRQAMEEALNAGQEFSAALTASFGGDEGAMRSYIRGMPLDKLKGHFQASAEKIFSTPVYGFLDLVRQWNASASQHQARRQPIEASPRTFDDLEIFLRMLKPMKENQATLSAMIIEERIEGDIIGRMTNADQRNRMRGLLYGYQLGAY